MNSDLEPFLLTDQPTQATHRPSAQAFSQCGTIICVVINFPTSLKMYFEKLEHEIF